MEQRKTSRIWFTACLAWAGSFRIHEILSVEKKKFDPTVTLLGSRTKISEVKISNEKHKIMSIFLKSPKKINQ